MEMAFGGQSSGFDRQCEMARKCLPCGLLRRIMPPEDVAKFEN
jgi:hypothetical protein